MQLLDNRTRNSNNLLVWKSFIVNKSKPKKDRVIIEYKYGPLTTLRRGEAMKRRRELRNRRRLWGKRG